MKKVVLDANLVLKWILREGEQSLEIARIIYDRVGNKEIEAMVPEFILVEVANVLYWKEKFSVDIIVEFIEFLKNSMLKIVPFYHFEYQELIKTMNEYDLTVFDAYYALLAEKYNCKIITFDKGFGDLAEDIESLVQ